MPKTDKIQQYVFDCPWHGLQSQVLCFRAFSSELRHRWRKLVTTTAEVPLEQREIDKYVEDLERRTR